jgi:hypothetical protein
VSHSWVASSGFVLESAFTPLIQNCPQSLKIFRTHAGFFGKVNEQGSHIAAEDFLYKRPAFLSNTLPSSDRRAVDVSIVIDFIGKDAE